ncbi:uncharacterized protein N7518_007092 [Penicillium psychrosexuale]|uniref:uncharacterized protein n=1 Tax=Penicillium psychrosexuale TaxID=1002107 RepID=UPI00254578E4|nr:uncharacterized protein N7518_007092 [Penicillium psychrosexuale]KAJ5790081.1 hypothetical protein N7518_007092 [Penicillium psychrosexuale]
MAMSEPWNPPESESEYEILEAQAKRSLAPCAWLGPKTQEARLNNIIGLVVEFVVAIDEARVRFTDDALIFCFFCF